MEDIKKELKSISVKLKQNKHKNEKLETEYEHLNSIYQKRVNTLHKRLFENKDKKVSILINMELNNKNVASFYVNPNDNIFEYKKGTYIIQTDYLYFNQNLNVWCLDYHQSYSIPVQRSIPVQKIKKSISDNIQYKDIEYSTDPKTLQNFIVAKLAEGIMKGQEISEYLKKYFLITMITGLMVLIILVITLNQSGALKNIF